MPETLPLAEVRKEIEEAKGRERCGHSLASGSCQVVDIGVQVTHEGDIGVALETSKGGLQEREVVEVGGRQVGTNKGHAFLSGDNNTTQNIGAMEQGRFNVPALWAGTGAKCDAALGTAIGSGLGFRTGDIITEVELGIDIIRDLGFSEDGQVVVSVLDGPYSDGQAGVSSIANVVGPYDQGRGFRSPPSWGWRLVMERVLAMVDRVLETYGLHGWFPQRMPGDGQTGLVGRLRSKKVTMAAPERAAVREDESK